jgi:MYXO-CTERM domain-containing protein
VQRGDLEVRCVISRGGELYVCADDYTDGFGIGRSRDGGDTFVPFLRLHQITGILDCAPGTLVRDTCAADQATIDAILRTAPGPDAGAEDAGPPDAGGLDAGADAGTTPPPPGCACSASSPAPTPWAWLLAAIALAARRRG